MEDSAGQSGGTVEEPPPPPPPPLQDQSASESLLDSTVDSGPSGRRPPPPPSPLTGCYLLIVIGEPHSERHKEIILQKISKGFLSWDVNECHVSLEKELQSITVQSPEGEEARYAGERLIQYATENLVTEILIHPQLNTLHQCMKNLLSSFTKHRHIIHAGYTFAGNGSWILQDGTLSISDLVEALHEAEVLRVLKAYENSVTIDVHCAAEGDWTTERFQREPVSKLCKIRVNPDDVMTAGDPAISAFIEYLSPFLEPTNIQQLLQPTDVVGNIRFTHPTLYVFPGGQGDAALFGINGFNMLVDGGFSRKACFWDFARHLDRLDAVLLTRLNNSTVNGISAVLQRKKMNHVYPQIGHFFCNLQDRKIALSPDGDKDKDSLIVNLAEEGQEIVANLKHLALKPHPCYRDGNQVDPVNLYHKVGHGKLDMYVISPARDSQAVKEFLAKWSANDNQLFSNTGKKIGSKGFDFPIQNLVSICALLVWQPANPNDTITRILFPGSTPQHKIFEGLDKLRHLEFLKHSVCSARSISPSASAITVTRSLSKTRQPEDRFKAKTTAENVQRPSFDQKSKPKPTKQLKPAKPKSDTNKLAEEKAADESKLEGIKKIGDRIYDKDEKIENITKEIQKIRQESALQRIETDIKKIDQNEEEVEKQTKKIVHRSKYDMRNVKSKVDSRAPSKSVDRKKPVEKKAENGGSPPITPKKAAINGSATRSEKSRSLSRTSRGSPSATPGKSVKEANNRKVVEARVISRTTKAPLKTAAKKEETTPQPPSSAAAPSAPPTLPATAKTERKPISRRPKAISPAKKAGASPVRAAKAAKPAVESAAKKIVRKLPADLDKTGTDSTVSTPSADVDATIAKKEAKESATEPAQVAQEAKTDLGAMTETEENKQVDMNNLTENKETDEEAVKETEVGESKSSPKESVPSIEIEMKEETRDEGGEEEEEDYLIITKEEPAKVEETEKDDSLQEDAKTKDETEGEGEIKKIHRDEEDSEKKRKMMEAEEEGVDGEKEGEEAPVELKKEEGSEETPKSSDRKDAKESEVQPDEGVDLKEPASKEQKEGESQPDEKFSTTFETSATTATTLPEDEKIEEPEKEGKDEEKEEEEEEEKVAEEELVEEKYTKEEIKDELKEEKVTRPEQPSSLTKVVTPAVPTESEPPQQRVHPRDLVKTPDEVADLPVHEEVDPELYASGEFNKDLQKVQDEVEVEEKPEEAKVEGEEEVEPVKADFKAAEKGEANILDEKDGEEEEEEKEESEMKKLEEDMNETEKVKAEETEEKPTETLTNKYLDIIDQLERSSSQDKSAEGPEEKQEKSPHSSGKSSPSKGDEGKAEVAEGVTSFTVTAESVPVITEEKADEPLPIMEEEEEEVEREPSPKEKSPGEEVDQKEAVQVEEVIEKLTVEKLSETVSSGKSSPAPSEKEIRSSGKVTPVEKEASGESTPAPSPMEEDNQPKESAEPEVDIPPEEKIQVEGVVETTQMLIESEKEWYVKERAADAERVGPALDEPKIEPQVSGKSTPVAEVAATSGKSTPVTDQLEKGTPVESGKATPAELSGKVSPATSEQECKTLPDIPLSGKVTPVPSVTESSGKITPAPSDRGETGKVTPAPLDESGEVSPAPSEKDVSGKVTPVPSEKEASGIVTLAPLDKDETGKVSPVPSEKDISGKVTPAASEKDESEKVLPAPLEKDVSGKVTPAPSEKDVSERVTPTPSQKDESGKVSPALPDKQASGKATPEREEADKSGKASPVEKLESGKLSPPTTTTTTAAEEISVKSGKATPEVPGRLTPEAQVPGEKTPEEKTSGKQTPERESAMSVDAPVKSGSGRTTPASEKDASEKQTAAPSDAEASGKATPAPSDKDISGNATPAPSERDISGKVTPEVPSTGKASPAPAEDASGKATLELFDKEPIKDTPTPSEKDLSRKATPEIASGQVTPGPPEEGASGKVTPAPSDKEVSGEAMPVSSETEPAGYVPPSPSEKGGSGKVSPDVAGNIASISAEVPSGKATPITKEKEEPVPSEKGEGELSGKSSPLLEKEPTEMTQAEQLGEEEEAKATPIASGEGTPIRSDQNGTPEVSEKETFPPSDKRSSGKSSPEKDLSQPEKALSGVSTPGRKASDGATSDGVGKDLSDRGTPISSEKDVSENITSMSGKESPLSEKGSLGKATPNGVGMETPLMSGKGTPSERDIETSGKTTPEKDASGKATPAGIADIIKDSPLPESPKVSGKASPTAEKKSLLERASVHSGKSTPLEALKSSSIASSLPESPAPSSGVVSPTGERRSVSERMTTSGKSTPMDKADGSLANGIGGPDEELEKGILESERHEKESQLSDDISSGEEEELKALEQADDGDDSESEGGITRERLQSLTRGEMASRTPDSATGSPKKKRGSSASSTPGEHITQESAQSSPKGKKDDINKLVKSVGETDNQAAVKRMLVTASSEDGGGETEICPHGSIRLSKTETQAEEVEESGEGEKKEEEEFGSLISQARREYNLQRSRKSSTNTTEQPSSGEEEEGENEVMESEGPRGEEEFGSLILQAQREYNLQRSRRSSRTSPEQEDDDVPPKRETISTTTISKTESSRMDENDMTIMITTILTEEREEQEDGSVRVTKTKEVITKGGKDEGSVVTVEEGTEEGKKSEEFASGGGKASQRDEETGSRETSICSTISQEDLTTRKDSTTRLEELRGSSVEMSPLKTTYITSEGGDAEELMTSSFYGRGEEEVLEYRREKGYESFTQIGPDGEKTEKTYFYTSDPEVGMSSGMFMKGIPEAIPEAPEMTFETFPTRDSFLPEDFAKAVDEHRTARGEYLGQGRSQTPKDKPEEKEKDLLEGWGKPLGLPLPPKNARNSVILTGQNISTTSSLSTPSDNSDSVTNWGHPMNLPSPVPPATQNGNSDPKETPKKDRKPVQTKKTESRSSGTNTPSRRSESPVKQPERRALSAGRSKPSSNSFLYLDLTYVPHHGNSYYSNVEFFKRVRARYYVFSGTEPSKEVYNALLEAKQTWEDKELEVTIIPTYDTDILGYWVAENEEILAKNKIDLSPSASRCTINLQDHETSCSAYRLEF